MVPLIFGGRSNLIILGIKSDLHYYQVVWLN